MMSNIISTPLSDRRKRTRDLTHDGISSTFSRKNFPAIYVESEHSASVSDGVLTFNGSEVLITDKTMVEIVDFLRDNGASVAELVSSGVSGYPASLLQNFNSFELLTVNTNVFPIRLSECHSKYSNNLVQFSEENITRNVLGVWRKSGPVRSDILNSSREMKYKRDNDLVFLDDTSKEVTCMLEYRINKYFLFASSESITNSHNIIRKHYKNNSVTPDVHNLLSAINSNNKDIL